MYIQYHANYQLLQQDLVRTHQFIDPHDKSKDE